MERLSHCYKLHKLSAFLVGNFIFITTLNSGVIQFFDPLQTSSKTLTTSLKMFMANDPVSIDEFLHDFGGKYSALDGQNIALLDTRFDVGGGFGKYYYVGYFYQYDVFIDTDRDFTDLFYAVKNKNNLISDKDYLLDLDILGIKQHGLVCSGNRAIFEDDTSKVYVAVAGYLSYGLDMQDGFIRGRAKTVGDRDYDAQAESSYYYTHNYLYDLDVASAHGYGYGFHGGIYFEDKKSHFLLKFLVNDVVSKMHWKDLPYSKISLQTSNKSYDQSGYVKYAPTISGLEKYRDFTQTLEPKYKLEGSMAFDDSLILGGVDFVYGESFPYAKVAYSFYDSHTVELLHESRFGSFGLGYGYKNFKLSVIADDFSHNSSLGLSSSFYLKF